MNRLLLIALFSLPLLGATGAGEVMYQHNRCETWIGHSDNDTDNRRDWCDGGGRDDAEIHGQVLGTDVNVPPGYSSSARSFHFDGDNDWLSMPDGSMDKYASICLWVAPDAETDFASGSHYTILTAGSLMNMALAAGDFPAKSAGGGDSNITIGDTDVATSNLWTFVCHTWNGANNQKMRIFNSRISDASNSIRDCDNGGGTCGNAPGPYGNPAITYRWGILHLEILDFKGEMYEMTAYSIRVNPEQVCLLCRGGPSNMQFDVDVSTDNRNITHDRIDICNACTLPENVTHVGPRRFLMP